MRSRSSSARRFAAFVAPLLAALVGAGGAGAQQQIKTITLDLKTISAAEANSLALKIPPSTAIVVSGMPRVARDALLQKLSVVPGNMQPPPGPSAHEGKIFGGQAAQAGEYPWQVGLIFRIYNDASRVLFCGGTLVAPDKVVTAAHCFKDSEGETKAHEVDVLAGTNNYSDPAQGERIQVRSVVLHPQYDITTFRHDVAVVTLSRSSTRGQAIPLYGANNAVYPVAVGSALYISGWGTTTNNGAQPQELQWAMVPTADPATCNAAQAYAGAVTSDMICAGYPGGKIDACKGDSGGPAVYRGTNLAPIAPVLYGVVSWGARGKCAEANKLGVYAGVPPHLAWLAGAIK